LNLGIFSTAIFFFSSSFLFYFILFYFILFYFILFYFILFYFILFCFVLFCFVLFCRTEPVNKAQSHVCGTLAGMVLFGRSSWFHCSEAAKKG